MLVAVGVLMVVMLFTVGAASAQKSDTVVVEVGPTAKLIDAGQAVRAKVKVECEPPAEVLEAIVTVHQDEGTAFGEAGITSVACDGKKRAHKVTVQTVEGTFRRGRAFVSAFVLVCLDAECAESAQGQDSKRVRVVGS